VAAFTWIPRHNGPIDLRWDGSVYYTLGTSLAQGHGYRLLNEPGAIRDIQYPPLLPAIVAAHQLALGTNDATIVGEWLRATAFLLFLGYAALAFLLLSSYLPVWPSVIGTLISLLCLDSWFLSDALYPEVWFAAATAGFLLALRSRGGRLASVSGYVCAVAAYGFRTVGVVAFPVWILDSVLRRRWRQAGARCLLAAIPVLVWLGYVFRVERSDGYAHPAYVYQRAPYMFYNVSYATNVALRDPFTPEKGEVRPLRRVVRNLTDVPESLGETLTIPHRYLEMVAHSVLGDGPHIRPAIVWTVFAVLSVVGGALVGGGLVALILHRDWLSVVYLSAYLAALCATPFPAQFPRYLMPVMPLLALAALTLVGGRSIDAGPRRPRVWRWLLVAVSLQIAVLVSVFVREHAIVSYVDETGHPVTYRLFFYGDADRGFDEVVDQIRRVAKRDEVVAAGTPHWIHLRSGLRTVMPPFERDAATEERYLDSVPVGYLVIGKDVVESERYTRPVVDRFGARWTRVFTSSSGGWDLYGRLP
jgi:hypothetical protein